MDWLINNWQVIVEVLAFLVSVITSFFLYFRTKDVKYLKEIPEMIKYRTMKDVVDSVPKGQTFEQFKPVYRLNKATGELELTDEVIDIRELVNSCKDVCLQACLERFIPTEEQDDDTELYSDMLDDLDIMAQVAERAEEYREAFGLDGSSIEEVFSYVGQHAEELKKKLDAAGKKTINKGGTENGTTSETQSKDVQKD